MCVAGLRGEGGDEELMVTSTDARFGDMIEATRGLKETHLAFEVVFLAPKNMLAPVGVHVVNGKQIPLSANQVFQCE